MITEFHDLEMDTTLKALQALEAIGKCIVVRGDSEDALVSYEVLVLQRIAKLTIPYFISLVQGVKFAK